MREKYQLSEREWQVMNFMWDQEKAVTSMDILESLPDVMPNATYVHRTINSLTHCQVKNSFLLLFHTRNLVDVL